MFDWTPERVGRLRVLAADGMSGAEIASEIGGVSRCAVLGKADRLGVRLTGGKSRSKSIPTTVKNLHQHTAQRIAQRAKDLAKAAATPALPATEAIDLPAEIIPEAQRKTVDTVGRADCRWPVGDPMLSDFHFCGAGATRGPYCSAHAQLAYETSAERRKRVADWRFAQARAA